MWLVIWSYFVLLTDVERYSDKYQKIETSDNNLEWKPGEWFMSAIHFSDISVLFIYFSL